MKNKNGNSIFFTIMYFLCIVSLVGVVGFMVVSLRSISKGNSSNRFTSRFEEIIESDSESTDDTSGPSDENIIVFAIETKEFYAIEGMTWADWVNSQFDTDVYGYRITADGYVASKKTSLVMVVCLDGFEVRGTDAIWPNTIYEIVRHTQDSGGGIFT